LGPVHGNRQGLAVLSAASTMAWSALPGAGTIRRPPSQSLLSLTPSHRAHLAIATLRRIDAHRPAAGVRRRALQRAAAALLQPAAIALARALLPPLAAASTPAGALNPNRCSPRPGRRRLTLPLLASLLPGLSGCASFSPVGHQTLHVLLVPTARVEWLHRDYRDQEAWQPLLDYFHQIHPSVQVQISVQSEHGLTEFLQKANSRGLGPDLLLVRSPMAVALLNRGLIRPLPDSAGIRRSLTLLLPNNLSRVRTPKGIAGLPLFNEITLACYDRSRVPRPPTTVDELLALAASGRSIGLTVEPIGIWWTAGALGAQEAMGPIIVGDISSKPRGLERDRQQLLTWLRWLRRMTLQSHVDVGSGPEDLTMGLESGRLSWIPCYSLSLKRLDRTMGKRLGVAPLPSGPGGPPSPYSSLRVWALGLDSSPSQRRLALALAEMSLDPLVQREITLSTRMVLPSNRTVPVPVASSGQLASLAAAERQFEQGTPLLALPFSADRVQRVLPTITTLLSQVMVGVLTPEQGADRLLELSPAPRRPSP
jgi:arabinogalactan oligomer/maltooligosaccharide transport system substrate-binding protein